MSAPFTTINSYPVSPLTKDLATKWQNLLAQLADQIPLVDYTPEDVIAESKDHGQRLFHAKWQHSLIVMDQDQPIAFITAYEREAEGNDQYPHNTLYVSEFAVDPNYQRQGLGRQLFKAFLNYNQQLGFLELPGDFNISIQTNSADWNQSVLNLYQSFGFTQRATKQYDNRTDVILEQK
jgi:GNAT superfamily N-acetyltransferase